MLTVAVAWSSSDDNAVSYKLCTFRFVDYVMFSHYCFVRFQPVADWFLQCWRLANHIYTAVRQYLDSLSLVISEVQLWAVRRHSSGKASWEYRAAAVGLCCVHNAPVCCPDERQNCHLPRVLQQLIFVEDIGVIHSSVMAMPIVETQWLTRE